MHRELASGLSCPVGFKNGNRWQHAHCGRRHSFGQLATPFPVGDQVRSYGHQSTMGNEDCHVILRGGKEPNYDAASVDAACAEIARSGLAARLMVDFSHGNSRKQFKLQMEVCDSVAEQISGGEERIMGVMVESHLVEGRQDLSPDKPLTHGQSVTDACINWDDSVAVMENWRRPFGRAVWPRPPNNRRVGGAITKIPLSPLGAGGLC